MTDQSGPASTGGQGSAAPQSSSAPPGSTGPREWRLIWADEFDAPAGSPPDPEHWLHATGDGSANGNPGWGNQELQSYTTDPANAATDGEGNLVITAIEADGALACYYGPCRYTSARLLTVDRFAFKYGRVESRLRVAPGQGLWSALWMLGTDIGAVGWPACGEIDIMENVGRLPERLFGTLHGPGYSGSNGHGVTIDLPAPLADDFHVYAIEWDPERIRWTIDGETYFEATPGDVAPNRWVYDHEFYLLVNLAVGGGLGGPVRADTTFPSPYLIDYIRVYQS